MVYKIACEDLLGAISTAQALSGMSNLTDKMKQTLIDGVLTMKTALCGIAYDYYSMHDFEVTDAIVPVMREVVQTKLLGGC